MSKNPADIIAIFEQFDTHMENVAKLVAGYRKSLIELGIPEPLADKMVINLQNSLMEMGRK